MESSAEPPHSCSECERLVAYRNDIKAANPDWFNAPVPSFGPDDARLLIVGLAPGLKGAHRTGRPFTGDYAGDLLYATLIDYGFAKGTYRASADDGLVLEDCMITNAVRCVPPANKPTTAEIKTCRPFLTARMSSLHNIRIVLALGRIAHDSVVTSRGMKKSAVPFGHCRVHDLGDGLTMVDSYHCSRYNTNTGRLTPDMFNAVFDEIKDQLSG